MSTYWFGDGSAIENWTQIATDATGANVDTGFSFSWQGMALAPGAAVRRSVLVTFGIFNADRISLNLEFPSVEGPFYYLDSLDISGDTESTTADDLIQLFVVVIVDDDVTRVMGTGAVYPSGAQFVFEFRPFDYRVAEGGHNISFYAINQEGSISEPQVLVIAIAIYEPSATPAATITPPQSKPASATPVPTASIDLGQPTAPSVVPHVGGSVGLIVGATAGACVVLAVVVVLVVMFLRKRAAAWKFSAVVTSDQTLGDDLMSNSQDAWFKRSLVDGCEIK